MSEEAPPPLTAMVDQLLAVQARAVPSSRDGVEQGDTRAAVQVSGGKRVKPALSLQRGFLDARSEKVGGDLSCYEVQALYERSYQCQCSC